MTTTTDHVSDDEPETERWEYVDITTVTTTTEVTRVIVRASQPLDLAMLDVNAVAMLATAERVQVLPAPMPRRDGPHVTGVRSVGVTTRPRGGDR